MILFAIFAYCIIMKTIIMFEHQNVSYENVTNITIEITDFII